MKILLVGLKKSYQLIRVREEGEKRGHQVEGCYTSDLIIDLSESGLHPRLASDDLYQYDLIYFWALDKCKHEWYIAGQHLRQYHNTIIVDASALKKGSGTYASPLLEYRLQTEYGLRFPKTVTLSSGQSFQSLSMTFNYPVIIKGSQSRQGRGVFLAQNQEEALSLIKRHATKYPSMAIREFIPNDGDIRIFTVGYRAIGAMKRARIDGDYRSNISQGALGSPFDLDAHPAVREMAETLSRLTEIEIAGVDIMLHQDNGLPYILEINPGPEMAGLERYTKTNAGLEIIRYFESLHQKKNEGQ